MIRKNLAVAIAVVFVISILFACGSEDSGTNNDQQQSPVLPLQQVTTTGGTEPSVSPGGQMLAYKGISSGIILQNLSGGVPDTLITYGVEPDWSPTGDLLIFRNGGVLATLNPSTSNVKTLRSDGFDDGITWSPLGNEIAAQGSSGIVFISYPDGNLSNMTCSDPIDAGCEGEEPTWSPDGQWLAFEDGLQIMKVKRSGGAAETVITDLNDVTEPAWSPDGKYIAFVMADSNSTDLHIWVTGSDGTQKGLWRVTATDINCSGSPCMDRDPCWSPDSKVIYFSSNRSGQMDIWRIGFEPK